MMKSVDMVESNYCVNCDTFLSCLIVCRNGYNKLDRADRWKYLVTSSINISSMINIYFSSNICFLECLPITSGLNNHEVGGLHLLTLSTVSDFNIQIKYWSEKWYTDIPILSNYQRFKFSMIQNAKKWNKMIYWTKCRCVYNDKDNALRAKVE